MELLTARNALRTVCFGISPLPVGSGMSVPSLFARPTLLLSRLWPKRKPTVENSVAMPALTSFL